MSRRVVLRLNEHTQHFSTVEKFLSDAKELGAGPRARVLYAVHPKHGPVLIVELPESASVAIERKEQPPVLSKTQQAVRDQREARKTAVAAGEQVPGHVEPVVKRKRLKRRTA